jgi:hypothetical protein
VNVRQVSSRETRQLDDSRLKIQDRYSWSNFVSISVTFDQGNPVTLRIVSLELSNAMLWRWPYETP